MTKDPLNRVRDQLLIGVGKEPARRRRRRVGVALTTLVVAVGAASLVQTTPWQDDVDDAVVAGEGGADAVEPKVPTREKRRAEEQQRLEELDKEIADNIRYGSAWERLDGFPDVDAQDGAPAVVWVRSRFFVWGGGGDHASMYFPPAGPTVAIPDAPISFRSGPAAVAVGDSVFIWGGVDGNGLRSDGATFDVGEQRWTELPPAPLPAGPPLAAVGAGNEILVFGQQDRLGAREDLVRGAAFDPSSGAWRRLPDAPVAVNSGNGVWTGSELVVLGSRLDSNNAGAAPTAMAYSPAADQWRVLPSPDLVPQSTWLVSHDGRLYAWDYLLDAAVLDLAASQPAWRALPPIPLDEKECYVSGSVSHSRVLATYCSEGALLEQDETGWTVLPAPSGLDPLTTPLGAVIVTDDGAWRLRPR